MWTHTHGKPEQRQSICCEYRVTQDVFKKVYIQEKLGKTGIMIQAIHLNHFWCYT